MRFFWTRMRDQENGLLSHDEAMRRHGKRLDGLETTLAELKGQAKNLHEGIQHLNNNDFKSTNAMCKIVDRLNKVDEIIRYAGTVVNKHENNNPS